jgi:hypothetical protein
VNSVALVNWNNIMSLHPDKFSWLCDKTWSVV